MSDEYGRPLASRVMKARHESLCPICLQPIRVGQQIAKAGVWQHVEHVIVRQRLAADLAATDDPDHPDDRNLVPE